MRQILYTIFLGILLLAQGQRDIKNAYAYEYIPDVSDSVIELRLKAIEGDISLHFTDEVKKQIQFYTVTRRDYARKMLNRSTKYFPIFEKYLAENKLPDELKYLSIVESGLHPNAVSHAAAVGLWQFIYLTGKNYGLESNWYIDDRMDPDKSTQAACEFLRFLHGYLGDWELALAGYNSGAGRVNRAIRYADGQRDFTSIYKYLPKETQAYVPKFVAVMYVFKYAEEHNLYPDAPEYLPVSDTIQISQYFHLETFSSHANLCMDDLEALNPQVKHGAIPASSKQYPLRIPANYKETITGNRKVYYDSAGKVGREMIEKLALNEVGAVAGRDRLLYVVKSGDVLGSIAQRYHVKVSDIQKWNKLNGSMIRAGQTLKIWVLPKHTSAAKQVIATQQSVPTPILKPGQKTHYVLEGDTLWDISVAHKISIEKIKTLNNLPGDNIRAGQTLIVSGE